MAPDNATVETIGELTKLGEGYKKGENGAREGLISAASKLLSQLMLPEESMLLLQWAQPTHQAVLRLGLDIHLFEALAADDGSPKTSTAIAEKTHPRAETLLVSRMLRHLAAMGTLTETDIDTFAPTPLSRSLADERFRDAIAFITDGVQPVLQQAPAYFAQTGYAAPKSGLDGMWQHAYDCKGMGMFEYFEKVQPVRGKQFASLMSIWSRGQPKWFQEDYYPFESRLLQGAKPDEAFIVDIGGGSGHDLQQLRDALGARIPGKLVLQDRPEIVELANVAPEIVRMSHDFLTEQPVKGARAYYMHAIIQDWDDATCTQILLSIIPAMERGYSKIIINDFVVPDRGAHWVQTSLDLELMLGLAARHRTLAEHTAVIEGAGLRVVQIFRHPQSFDSLIEVELP